MSRLAQRVEEYLTIRRALGYKLVSESQLLASFVAYAGQACTDTITTDLAVAWARQPASTSDVYLARRLRSGAWVRPLAADARPRHRGPAP